MIVGSNLCKCSFQPVRLFESFKTASLNVVITIMLDFKAKFYRWVFDKMVWNRCVLGYKYITKYDRKSNQADEVINKSMIEFETCSYVFINPYLLFFVKNLLIGYALN